MAGGGKANPTISRIADPYPNIITNLENINRQVNLFTANIIGEPPLGSVTATRRNSSSKIFVIGFMAPTTPTNHVPIKTVSAQEIVSAASSMAGGAEAQGEEALAEARAAGLELSGRSSDQIQQNVSIMIYTGTTRIEQGDPNVVRLKKNIRAADSKRRGLVDFQVAALRTQIQAVKNTPPLIMLINPREFTRNYEQAVDSSIKGRFGQIVHSWLERPIKIGASGVSAAQYVVDAGGSGGLTTERRVHSISYMNLMSLLMLYKNNGVIFAGAEAKAERGIPVITFSIYIYYDNHIYIGSFDDFEITDSAAKPYNMEYSFKFNVRYDMDIDSSHLVESAIFSPDPRQTQTPTATF